MTKKSLYVINSESEKKPFSFWKIYRSARRAGASKDIAQQIASTIQQEAFPGIKTADIFKRVRELLAKEEIKPALKFSLKQAIKKLGPTGFPFEKYIGEILSRMGYKVKLNQQIPGYCCRFYEIDFVAENDRCIYVGECKFRHLQGGKVHSDVALSNYARFLDIKKGNYFSKPAKKEIKSFLVTNAKFTSKAIDYSSCVGVRLLGWNYPKNKGLEYLIETYHLYPITILPSWRQVFAEVFVRKKMMLAEDLLRLDVRRFSKKTGLPLNKIKKLQEEAQILFS
ncbi:hypothetical protein J7K24_01970 [bacterium]|nr:hypothetical protein [bacterium]